MYSNNKYTNMQNKQFGLSLTEVLIAVVILSIGMLGIAGLQIMGLRGTHSSNLRSQATFMANDIAERMRANPLGIANPNGNIPQNSTYADVDMANIVCNANVTQCINNAGAPCTTLQMTQYDIQTWLCGTPNANGIPSPGIRNLLPQGSATISCTDLITTDTDNCSAGSTLTVQVSWGERDAGTGESTNQMVELLIVP